MSGRRLREALRGVRPEIEAGLADAEAELEQLERRRQELIDLIAQARAAVGLEVPASEAGARTQTLHEAIAQVLREHDNEWMTAREVQAEVNGRSLYRKRDGSPVELNQIHARTKTKNYANLFEKNGPKIRLRTSGHVPRLQT